MAVRYLENHTVRITPELWNFLKTFKPDESSVPVELNPTYHAIKFVGIPSEVCDAALVRNERLDRTHVKSTVDIYFTKKYRRSRTGGFRSWNIGDTENVNGMSESSGMYFDLKGNVMRSSTLSLSLLERKECTDIMQYLLYAFLFVNQLLAVKPEYLVEDELPVKKVKKDLHGSKKKTSGTVTTAATRLYKTYRVKRDFDFSERNPIVRTCRLWIVRGHDRHYSNGNVVHIDPYYKGIDRQFGKDPNADVDNFGRKIIINSSAEGSKPLVGGGKEAHT